MLPDTELMEWLSYVNTDLIVLQEKSHVRPDTQGAWNEAQFSPGTQYLPQSLYPVSFYTDNKNKNMFLIIVVALHCVRIFCSSGKQELA